MDDTKIVIGSASSAQIILAPRHRTHVGATDYWDGNWVNCTVSVRAGGFRGEYIASLRAEEFTAFRADLERLHRDLGGAGGFHFRNPEKWGRETTNRPSCVKGIFRRFWITQSRR